MSPEQKTVAILLLGTILAGWVFSYLRDNVLAWSGAVDLTRDTARPPVLAVYVTGCVKAPGVYRLPKGSRVEDAIAAAGGLLDGADSENLNLAAILSDGQRLHIPVLQRDGLAEEQTSQRGHDNRINLNTATERDLESLPGIGPEIARRIVEYRQQNGRFTSVDDLKKVSGIGEKTLNRIRQLLRVR